MSSGFDFETVARWHVLRQRALRLRDARLDVLQREVDVARHVERGGDARAARRAPATRSDCTPSTCEIACSSGSTISRSTAGGEAPGHETRDGDVRVVDVRDTG